MPGRPGSSWSAGRPSASWRPSGRGRPPANSPACTPSTRGRERRSPKRQQRHAPLLAAFNSTPLCAYWPTGNRMPKAYQKTFPELLVVQSELDAATAYEGALSTGKKLPGAKMISVDNEGSHGLFPYGTTCVDLPVIDYFLTGTTPRDRFTGCQGLPLPGEEKTYEVAGELKKNGKIKIRMRTDEVKEANRLVRDLLREANTPDPAEAAVSQSS
ncbi:alpha/beta hydrolase [Streptomyces sp. WMMC897]|uniref:alpha/beta hydrolase n=1 Tax=Streptomyces sp. WMMC897 TaxID=3014782 RepID=UPI0022B6E205|nr:alpha/beta hydrolase [Streptomyces sp. WMMC897]MCZ7415005.1 alpha/beta hydrolase [Streptomyces sp. WMMC897]